jgi:hypothetical protein
LERVSKKKKEDGSLNLDEVISQFYEECDQLGFQYRCKMHNHLNNKDEYMKMHLFKEHNISIPFKNWKIWFTLFSVGDSISSDYRCSLCNHEFMFEKDAKKHILEHGIQLEETN